MLRLAAAGNSAARASEKDRRFAFRNYAALETTFMRYTLSLTLLRRGLRFITGSPDVYIRYYGVAPQHYGWLFAVNIVGDADERGQVVVQRHAKVR
jgi:DHA1 family bicyclomycin/chloramphenicol resistance-like MFS transporter